MAKKNGASDRPVSDDEEFEKLLREMEKIVGEAFRDSFDELKSGKTFIKGFSVRLGPDGDPHIDKFHEDINPQKGAVPEFGETDGHLSITLELPPVQEEDIIVDVAD